MGFLVELTKSIVPADIVKYISLAGIAIAIVAFVICLLAKGSKKSKFAEYCKSVSDYLAAAGTVNDANLDDFNAKCFSNAPTAVKEGWDAFLEERFGYPSDQFDKSACLPAVKVKSGVAGFYLFLSSVGFFISAGFAYSDKTTMAALATIPAAAFFFWLLSGGKGGAKKAAAEKAAYDKMMEDLDAAVELQQLFDYERDTEDLDELSAAINEIAEFENNKQPKSKAAPVEEEIVEEEEAEEAVEEDISDDDLAAMLLAEADEAEEAVEEEVLPEPVEAEEEPEPVEPEYVEEDIEPEPVESEYVEEEAVEEVEEVAEKEEVEEEVLPEPVEAEVEPEPVESEYVEEEVEAVEEEEVVPEPIESEYVEEEELTEEAPEEEIPEPIEPEYVEPEAPAPEPEKPTVNFNAFYAVLNAALGKGYNKATMKKLGTIIVLAFKKFDEPAQRDALKNCIKKFIKVYPKCPD